MRFTLRILLVMGMLTVPAAAQQGRKGNVLVEVANDGVTSELLDTRIGASAALSSALISLKYFGTQSDSDISLVLTVVGAKPRYDELESLGMKFIAGDTPLGTGKLRIVDKITREGEKDYIISHLTTEELAWLAGDSKVQIELYGIDSEKKYGTFVVLGAGMTDFKQFAKSVLLIKSHAQ